MFKTKVTSGAGDSSRRKYYNDAKLLLALLIVGLLLFVGIRLFTHGGTVAVVEVNGTEAARYALDKAGRYEISAYMGDGHNVLVVADGRAHIEDATCPDGLCMQQGTVYKQGESLICLPNRVVVRIE